MSKKSVFFHEEAYSYITQKFPFFIAHEYKRLYDLLEDEEYVGAFFEMKDIIEVILKLPILQISAYVEQHYDQDQSGTAISCAEYLLKKPMSLGDWHANCLSMYRLLKDHGYPEESVILLKNLFQFYKRNNIVSWRNDSIGHGAFMLNVNAYLDDVNKYLRLVTEFLMKNEKYYLALPIFLNGKLMQGTECLPDNKQTMEKIVVTGQFLGQAYEITPYIWSNSNYLYFFDSFIGGRQRTSILDYINGDKNKVIIDYFRDKYLQHFSAETIKAESRTMRSILKNKDDEFLKLLHYEKEYVRSDDLELCFHDWVDAGKYDRGIFLLKMNRGMGKTAFVSNHDPLLNPDAELEIPEDMSVRCYYCSRQSYRTIMDFVSTCNEALFSKSADPSRSYRSSDAELPRIDMNSGAFKQQMCSYFLQYLEIYDELLEPYKRICLFIDGLDEIPVAADADSTIFDFIPTPDMLPKGVYMILTSRIEDEQEETIPMSIQRRINQLTLTDQRVIRRNDPINQTNMRRFLEEKWTENISHDTQNQLMKIADNNFVNLKLLTEISHLKSAEDILQANEEEIFDLYVKSLNKQYGNSHFHMIKELLLILASEQETLTLEELSFLMGYDELCCEFIGILRDIQALIRIERSINGNRYSLANDIYRLHIMQYFKEQYKELVERWIDHIRLFKQIEEETNEIFLPLVREEKKSMLKMPGMSYLMAYILKFIELSQTEALKQNFENEIYCLEIAKSIMDYELKYECMNYGFRGITRDCGMNSNVIAICRKLDMVQNKEVLLILGRAYNSLGIQYGARWKHHSKAIPLYHSAVEVISKMDECDDKDIELGKVYNNLCYSMTWEGSYSFDDIKQYYSKSIFYRKQYMINHFYSGVERYMVTLNNYMSFLVRNKDYETAIDAYHEITGLYDKIKLQYPDKPYALVLSNGRYEYGYECLKITTDNMYGTILMEVGGTAEEAESIYENNIRRFREMDQEIGFRKMTVMQIRYCQTLYQYAKCSYGLQHMKSAVAAFNELLEALLKMGREEQSLTWDGFKEFVKLYGSYLERTDPENENMKKLQELEGYL